jgi:hypothetical protein
VGVNVQPKQMPMPWKCFCLVFSKLQGVSHWHNNCLQPRQLNQASAQPGNTKGGSVTVPLTSCLTGLDCMTTDIFCFYLQKRLIQTSQTGGQWYSDTSPFSIPWLSLSLLEVYGRASSTHCCIFFFSAVCKEGCVNGDCSMPGECK